MSLRTARISRMHLTEDETALSLEARDAAAHLRLALGEAHRRGGHFGRQNVEQALASMPVIEEALQRALTRLREERGAIGYGER
jgi:hypothetical protein